MDFSDVLSDISKDKFKANANKLLNECFIVKNCPDTKNCYYFILKEQDIFKSFFDLLGYDIVINEQFGVISLNNMFGTGRIRLKKRESIVLLILRLIYVEEKQKLSQSDNPTIVVDEVYERFQMLKLKPLDKTTIRSILGMFKRYHLIYNLDPDMGSTETRIQIYPSILLAVTSESLDEIYKMAQNKLEQYKGADNDDTDEYPDEEGADQT